MAMGYEMQPQRGDTVINIPVTFDYRGGRSSFNKTKIYAIIALLLAVVIATCFIVFNDSIGSSLVKIAYLLVVYYVALLILRFPIAKEGYYSNIYEEQLARDFELQPDTLWNIFDIDEQTNIVYFRNGLKGMFVRMEKGTITGKGADDDFDHFEAISNAYNIAHTLNMNITHIDYMDNVGNDPRMAKLYADLEKVDNPQMFDFLNALYYNLNAEMSSVYSCFDVYLFTTTGKLDNFTNNVRTVVSALTGGNFIAYSVLDIQEISNVCTALFNLEKFSVLNANNLVMQNSFSTEIVPIKVTKENGEEIILNKTMKEMRAMREAAQRQRKEDEIKKKLKKNKKNKNQNTQADDEIIDLFGDMGDSNDNNGNQG